MGETEGEFSSVQSLSRVQFFATPWITARQASLSITNSQSLFKLMSIESVMPSHHLILCCHLLLLPPIPPSIRVFSNESTLHMSWQKYWSLSFSICSSNEHQDWSPLGWTGWISWQSKGLSRVFSNTTVQKHQLGLVLMGRAMLSKSLIEFSADGQCRVPSLLFDLTKLWWANEDNGNLLQKVPCIHCCVQWPQPFNRPPLTHVSAGASWILTGKYGSVSCGVTAPFSWVLVHMRFYVLQESVSPALCKFWWLYDGVNGELL